MLGSLSSPEHTLLYPFVSTSKLSESIVSHFLMRLRVNGYSIASTRMVGFQILESCNMLLSG